MWDTPADLSPSTRRTSEVNRRESRTGNKSSRASSEGSCVQPSMGIPFAIQMAGMRTMEWQKKDYANLHLRYSWLVSCRPGIHGKDPLQLGTGLWCMSHLVVGYMTVNKEWVRKWPITTTQQRGWRTSRKKRCGRMPRPASNQSMTGSAYSCIDAVKITRVYHPET